MLPGARRDQELAQADGGGPSSLESHYASRASESQSASQRESLSHASPLSPALASPPASNPQNPDSSSPTIRPTSAPSGVSRPPIMRTSSGTSTVYSVHSTNVLPPPHALPSDSQPIMLQLNSVPDTSFNSVPSLGLGSPPAVSIGSPSPAQTQATLPPAPAHPALALMRSNSARSVPRRPLSAPRIPSGMRASTLPVDESQGCGGTEPTNNELGDPGYATSTGNGNGNRTGRGNTIVNATQRVSYTTGTSISPEKDRALFHSDLDAPTSPSGRPLRLELPELPFQHQYPAPAPRAATSGAGGGFGRGERVSVSQYAEERYRDSGMRTPMVSTMPGAFGNANPFGYDSQERERSMGPTFNPGMGDGGGGGPGGPGGVTMFGPGLDNNAYFDAYNETGIPRLPRTVNDRLAPTLKTVKDELAKSARRALVTGYAVNAAIGLQVLISALITALSAVTSGRRTQIMTSILGGAGTVVASYLARARGSNEPELSIARVKDLQRFDRACKAFVEDCGEETGWEGCPGYVPPLPTSRSRTSKHEDNHAHEYAEESVDDEEGEKDGAKGGGVGSVEREWDRGVRARELDDRIRRLRAELEHLLGNGNGERKLSQV